VHVAHTPSMSPVLYVPSLASISTTNTYLPSQRSSPVQKTKQIDTTLPQANKYSSVTSALRLKRQDEQDSCLFHTCNARKLIKIDDQTFHLSNHRTHSALKKYNSNTKLRTYICFPSSLQCNSILTAMLQHNHGIKSKSAKRYTSAFEPR
jgi:hypothetical protein